MNTSKYALAALVCSLFFGGASEAAEADTTPRQNCPEGMKTEIRPRTGIEFCSGIPGIPSANSKARRAPLAAAAAKDPDDYVPAANQSYGPLAKNGANQSLVGIYTVAPPETLAQIKAFVDANIKDGKLIADSAKKSGFHIEDIAAAMSFKVNATVKWFKDSGVERF